MTIIFVRVFFISLSVVVGYYIGTIFFSDVNPTYPIIGAVIGLVCGGLLILGETFMRKVSTRNLSAGLVGLIFGIFMSWVLTTVIKLIPMKPEIFLSIQIVLTLVFCYLGMVI